MERPFCLGKEQVIKDYINNKTIYCILYISRHDTSYVELRVDPKNKEMRIWDIDISRNAQSNDLFDLTQILHWVRLDMEVIERDFQNNNIEGAIAYIEDKNRINETYKKNK